MSVRDGTTELVTQKAPGPQLRPVQRDGHYCKGTLAAAPQLAGKPFAAMLAGRNRLGDK